MNVFKARKKLSGDNQVFELLLSRGVDRKDARQIQNLYDHCGFAGYGIGASERTPNRLYLFPPETPIDAISDLISSQESAESCFCIISPRKDRKRSLVCENLIISHDGMSIDKKGFISLFNSGKLNKQHIIL